MHLIRSIREEEKYLSRTRESSIVLRLEDEKAMGQQQGKKNEVLTVLQTPSSATPLCTRDELPLY